MYDIHRYVSSTFNVLTTYVAFVVDSNRYGLTNEDLNRRWSNPNQMYHPVIYHTKGLMEYCARVLQRPPHVFVDYHGHSRRKNVFLFGCSRSGSWSAADRAKPDQPMQYLVRESTESTIGNIFRFFVRVRIIHLTFTDPIQRKFITFSDFSQRELSICASNYASRQPPFISLHPESIN